ncbi:hypothetical protein [Pseudovibrio sp. Tun.PSC04-5.I4]|uniref:hypothetical protein n=1 Tax=Pseudovibrio sp. Tun.PSC04-5.I4 TaxID=1798213 RepID=UPI00088A7EB2|nr:hypothetical protein [Pseudovibrio sp. Tun.PSC04-5.I4]SDR01100.1 hypothetical protein SAMN04515695_2303 [Pseudovibrio sp. Tun.PSC04-5.I4]
MNTILPLPDGSTLDGASTAQDINWRSVGLLLSRELVLPNITNQPVILAQFNLLVAGFMPEPARSRAMVFRLRRTLHRQLTMNENTRGWLELSSTRPADHMPVVDRVCTVIHEAAGYLFSHKQQANLVTQHRKLVQGAEATLINHLSGRTVAGSTVQRLSSLKAQSPDKAATDWAEEMEFLYASGR